MQLYYTQNTIHNVIRISYMGKWLVLKEYEKYVKKKVACENG